MLLSKDMLLNSSGPKSVEFTVRDMLIARVSNPRLPVVNFGIVGIVGSRCSWMLTSVAIFDVQVKNWWPVVLLLEQKN